MLTNSGLLSGSFSGADYVGVMRVTVAAIFLLAMGAFGQNIAFQHDGLSRQYRIHIPENIQTNAPLVIALHG